MHRPFLLFITCLGLCVFTFSSCSASSNENTQSTKAPEDRKSGYAAPDGTHVGPRGKATSNGVPIGIGAYGDRSHHKGDLTITKDGTSINDLDVDGVIFVNADDVTISNFTAERVTQKPGKSGMVLEDGTIDGKEKKNDGIQWNDFTVRRMDISHSFDGIKAQGNVVIEDSYIHDLYAFRSASAGAGGYSHNDCIQVSVGTNILIERNWLDNCGFNSAIFIDPDQGPIDNVTVQHNYLNSGGYTLYVIASRSAENGLPINVTVANNVFGENHEFGYATLGSGVTFENNVTQAGAVVTPKFDDDNT